MNNEDMNKLVEEAAKTLFYVVCKTAKNLMDTGLGTDMSLAVATLQIEKTMGAFRDEFDTYTVESFIEEWEAKNG